MVVDVREAVSIAGSLTLRVVVVDIYDVFSIAGSLTLRGVCCFLQRFLDVGSLTVRQRTHRRDRFVARVLDTVRFLLQVLTAFARGVDVCVCVACVSVCVVSGV
jgi:hypothetical protein